MVDLAQSARFYLAARPLAMDEKAAALLDEKGRGVLTDLAARFAAEANVTAAALEALVRAFAEERGEELGKIAQPLRAALTGSTVSPPIFEVAELLGRTETLARMKDAATAARG
ncbi:Glutamate--tRNA ligase [compost metagenome]